jgi:hypothetical protein
MDIRKMNSDSRETTPDGPDVLEIDRRRPGRSYVVPSLVPLLRDPLGHGEMPADPQTWTAPEHEDGLGAIRGIALAVVLSLPVWAAIAWVVYWLF